MASERESIVVVGAGAAGLWAAARAAELGGDVLLLEKTPRIGTKVLASGGTRCNLTTTLAAPDAAHLFGTKGERFLRRAFRELGPRDVRERFRELGVETSEAPLEKVFPTSGRARDVRDALQRWATEARVRVRTNAPVRGVERGAEGGWRVRLGDGESVDCERLLLAPGGKSYPKTGTTGDGYAWLAALELALVAPAPALVPLTSEAEWVHALAGISMQDVAVRLIDPAASGKRRVLGERARPIVFTHRGISGPAAMDLSEPVARRAADSPPLVLQIDCVPDVERDELRALLIDAAGTSGAPSLVKSLARHFEARLPRRVVAALARQAGLASDNPPVASITKRERHALVEAIKGLDVPVAGTLGYDQAEVTAGGLALHELDPGSMRVRERDGLFVFGELLDLQGPIGGLNFQAAFATAELAARATAGQR